jgi:two-component system chemotaxis sensor kinase CheA
MSDDDILQAIGETFRVESAERVGEINRLLLELERGDGSEPDETLDAIAREAHTLKGGASVLGLERVRDTAHAMEEVFEALRDARTGPPPELFDLLFGSLDRLGAACARLSDSAPEEAEALETLARECRRFAATIESGEAVHAASVPVPDRVRVEPPGARTPEARTRAAAPEETIRVPIGKLDSLMAQIGELLIARSRNDERLRTIRDLQLELEDAARDWGLLKEVRAELAHATGHRGRTLQRKRSALLDRVENHLKLATQAVATLRMELSRDAMHMSILVDTLREDIKKSRMLPLSTILGGFDRLVRDTARREGKQAWLEVHGAEIEVDKRILEVLKDPLMHLLRNAVSHGIESPAKRARAGKPVAGTVTVRTRQVGGQIEVEVGDDGRGFDTDRILERAAERGIVDAARSFSRREALQLIFHPGLSTADSVTDISGRGIGMDVVRDHVERVQGSVSIDTEIGKGSRVTITLPLTLSTTNCLVVDVAGCQFAIPIASVERVMRVAPDEITLVENTPAITVDGTPVGVVLLAQVLGVAAEWRIDDERLPVVLLNTGEHRLGCVVDSLVDERELVVKPLGRQLVKVPNISGGSITARGEIVIVVNPLEIVRNAVPSLSALASDVASGLARARGAAKRRVVVAEDSITTRTLSKSILETAGYQVVACRDGLEALEYLSAHPCDVLVADIEMPGLDGISLVERVRSIPAHRGLPVILLTSHGSDEDKRRGMLAGANGYIVKAEFDQSRFLETVRELL